MARKSSGVPERKSDLIVQKLGEDIIVYDRSSHRAHSLNRTAALVFEKLDGKKDLAAVARDLGKVFGSSPKKQIVDAAVNELAAADLLRPGAHLPRRLVLRGLAVGLLPVVVSITVPPAASAQSCVSQGGPCTYLGNECCPGLSCTAIGTTPGTCEAF